MQISFGAKIHYNNIFKPLEIKQTIKKQCTYYNFFDKKDKFVGKFEFADEGKYFFENSVRHIGYITGLEIPKWLRGTKESINVLFNIKNLALKEAQKKDMDIVHFAAGNSNPNHVAKLYKKLFPEATYKFGDGYTRFAVPIKEKYREQAVKLLDDFEMIYRNRILNSEFDLPPIINTDSNFL